MEKQIGINIIIEKEKRDSEIVFIASSPDINVFVEGKNIAEVKDKFVEGVKNHLETFPEDRKLLMKQGNLEMPIVQRIFL